MNMKKIFFLVAVALMLPMMSFAQERIMVISDPHVYPQTEIDKQANFDKYMDSQRKMLQLSEPIWHALLDTALKYKPDLVLIPGDLTKDGEAASHDTVAAGIHRLEAAGIPVLVIPGNHDIPASNDWKTHYSGTFKDAVSEDADSYSFAAEPLPGITVLGVDGSDGKASVGKLSASTLAWIEEQAYAAKAKGNQGAIDKIVELGEVKSIIGFLNRLDTSEAFQESYSKHVKLEAAIRKADVLIEVDTYQRRANAIQDELDDFNASYFVDIELTA